MAQTLAPSEIEVLSRLGVTERCCADDLDEDVSVDLLDLAKQHPIVQKFIDLRSRTEAGQETVRSINGPAPVFTLHAGRERGVTVADTDNNVVWLLAARTHRGGDHSDVYAYIERLHARGILFPSEADYRRLFERRNTEVVPLLVSRVAAVLERARLAQRTPHSVVLPGSIPMSLMVEPDEDDEDLERLWLAIDPRTLEPGWLTLIQAALTPGDDLAPWEYTKHFPKSGPDRRELRFTCVHQPSW